MANGTGILGGLADGLLKGYQLNQQREERAQRMEERQMRLDTLRKEKAAGDAAIGAARPMELSANMVKPDDMDNRDVGLAENIDRGPAMGLAQQGVRASTGQTFADPAAAQVAQTAYNDPNATIERVAATQMGTDPTKATTLLNAATARKEHGIKFNQEQLAYAKKLKDEGVLDGVAALRRGDGGGMVDAFNKSGAYKIEGTPEITSEEREVTGLGTIPTFNAKFNLRQPDGSIKPMTVNSHDLSMQTMQYDKMLGALTKGVDAESRAQFRLDMADVRDRNADTREKVGDAQVKRLEAQATADTARKTADNTMREHRIKLNGMLSETGKRLHDAQSTVNAMKKDPVFMAKARKAGTPEAEEWTLAHKRITDYEGERTTINSELAEIPKPASLASGTPAKGTGPNGKPSRDDSDKGQILTGELSKTQTALAAAEKQLAEATTPEAKQAAQEQVQRLTTDVGSLNKELGKSTVKPAGRTAEPAASSGVKKVATKAERDALPAGSRYRAPDGNVYIKK